MLELLCLTSDSSACLDSLICDYFRGNAIRENTIASLKKAAASGADMLEFDVQLSKDMIPVIYHDFHVCISMKRKKEVDFSEMLELPVKDLTLEHLQKLKVTCIS